MKRKFLLLTLLCSAFSLLSTSAQERAINPSELPPLATQYIDDYFTGHSITQAVVAYNPALEIATYKVDLSGGYEITFDTAGHWKELDSKEIPLPQKAIPLRIWEYVYGLTPRCTIQEIAAENEYYRVELSNDKELLFTPMGKLLAKE